MKKLLISLLLILTVSNLFSQKEIVKKIGAFKIYDSVNALSEMGFEKIIQIKTQKELGRFLYLSPKNKNNLIAEYIFDSSVKNSIVDDKYSVGKVYRNPKVRFFKIRNLELTSGLIIESVDLIYENDSLISFFTSSYKNVTDNGIEKLHKILDEKYGAENIEKIGEKTESTSYVYNYKTESPAIKCVYRFTSVSDSYGKINGSYNFFTYEDIYRIMQVNRVEDELKRKQVLDKIDIDKL